MPQRLEIIGKKFGRLTVRAFHTMTNHNSRWKCKCECGKEVVVNGGWLTSGNTKSCGCLLRDIPNHKTHGMSTAREYYSWSTMIQRCTNPNHTYYKNYGGRGISICSRWRNSFETFLKDMGIRPAGTSLDRKNNKGDYAPENCMWSDRIKQGANKRNNRFLIVDGVKRTVSQWSRITGIRKNTIRMRVVERGWSDKEAVMTNVGNPKGG